MSELEVFLVMLAVVAAYSLVYTNFVAGSSDSREKSHTAIGGRSVGSRWAGRVQRTRRASSPGSDAVGAVHPCPPAINTLPPQAGSSTDPAGGRAHQEVRGG